MGVCISNEKASQNDTDSIEFFNDYKKKFLHSSKQLYPDQDVSRNFLSVYYERHKKEIDQKISNMYLDALCFNTENFGVINFRFYQLALRQVKFLSIVLPYFTGITEIDLCQTSLNNKGLEYLVKSFYKLPNLTLIDISNNEITDLSYFSKAFKSLTNLEVLNLSNNKIASEGLEDNFRCLRSCKYLKQLILENIAIENCLINHLIDLVKNTRIIKVHINTNKFVCSVIDSLARNTLILHEYPFLEENFEFLRVNLIQI